MSVLELQRRPSASESADRQPRIIAAALVCFAKWGVAKTTFDDVARQAGVSRATVYRLFPGGREALLQTVAQTEITDFVDAIARAVSRATDEHADGPVDLEAVLVAGMSTAGRLFASHPVMQYLLRHEPEAVLPHLAFGHLDRVLHVAGEMARPLLAPFLDDDTARRVGEWSTRILLSYVLCPAEGVDIGDPTSIRTLVRTFILPGIDSEGAV